MASSFDSSASTVTALLQSNPIFQFDCEQDQRHLLMFGTSCQSAVTHAGEAQEREASQHHLDWSSLALQEQLQGMEQSDSSLHTGITARMGPGDNPELEESGH